MSNENVGTYESYDWGEFKNGDPFIKVVIDGKTITSVSEKVWDAVEKLAPGPCTYRVGHSKSGKPYLAFIRGGADVQPQAPTRPQRPQRPQSQSATSQVQRGPSPSSSRDPMTDIHIMTQSIYKSFADAMGAKAFDSEDKRFALWCEAFRIAEKTHHNPGQLRLQASDVASAVEGEEEPLYTDEDALANMPEEQDDIPF